MKTMTYLFNLTLFVVCMQFVYAADDNNSGSKVFISPAEEAAQVKADDYSMEKKLDEFGTENGD